MTRTMLDLGVVLLTGATGSLGAPLLHQIISSDNFRKIYCLFSKDETSAIVRILDSLKNQCIGVSRTAQDKTVALEADLSPKTEIFFDAIFQIKS